MKKTILLLILFPFLVAAQAPAGYYNGTTGLSGYALKSKLHEILASNKYTYHYGDLLDYYAQTDLDLFYENNNTILDIYSENPSGPDAYEYSLTQVTGSSSAEGLGWNREHMMPQSTFDGNYPMYSDLFCVVPTDARINQLRSNYPYGVGGSTNYYTFTNTSKISSNASPGSPYTGRVYEPIAEFKGDVARAMLYFIVRYEDKLPTFEFDNGTTSSNDKNPLDGSIEKGYESWFVNLMVQWHNADPVSTREIARNNSVFAIQKNRNPFIDQPSWVNLIWNQNVDAVAPNPATGLATSQVQAHFVELSWAASSSADVIGYKIFQGTTLLGTTHSTSFVVDHLTAGTPYQFHVVAYDTGYLESSASNIISTTTLASDSYATDLRVTKYLEGSSNNKAIEITNETGHIVDLTNYGFLIQFYNGTNYYFSGGKFELDGTINHGESIVLIHPDANFTCFPVNDARFITNAPQLTFTGSNYLELRYKNTLVEALGISDQNNSTTLGNVSLYRKINILNPSTNFSIAEWNVYPQNYCQELGTLSSREIKTTLVNQILIAPNPAEDKLVVFGENLKKIKDAKVYDMNGEVVISKRNPFQSKNEIIIENLATGLYILQLEDLSLKFIKK